MNLTFKDNEHQKTFNEYLDRAGCSFKDLERTALLYILSSDDKYRRQIERFYNFKTGLINSDSLDDVILSGGERAILKLAYHLFTGSDKYSATFCNTLDRLDNKNTEVVLNALNIRFRINERGYK